MKSFLKEKVRSSISSANSMLVIAFAGLNIEQAVIYKVAMKTLNQDTKGRAGKCFMELEF